MAIREYILLALSIQFALSFEHPNMHLINGDNCGLKSPGHRIHGGRTASLGEFPWMAVIKTRIIIPANNTVSTFDCGGTILNKNYILTAAHCIVNVNENLERRYGVEVGEFDKSKTPDCEGNVCAPNLISFETEEVITPSYYFAPHAGFDITLIRVRGEIEFNEFIAPICLEYGPLLTHDYAGEDAQVAGWGAYAFGDEDRKKMISPAVLQKLSVPVVNSSSCQDAMLYSASAFREYHNVESQICAGGVDDEFVYMGDSGGPLMSVKQMEPDSPARFYQIGVVSYGPDASWKKPFQVPAVFTRVGYYLPWILENMHP